MDPTSTRNCSQHSRWNASIIHITINISILLSIKSYSILQPFGHDFGDPLSKHSGTPQFATAKTTKNHGQRKFRGINHIDNVQEAFPHRKKE